MIWVKNFFEVKVFNIFVPHHSPVTPQFAEPSLQPIPRHQRLQRPPLGSPDRRCRFRTSSPLEVPSRKKNSWWFHIKRLAFYPRFTKILYIKSFGFVWLQFESAEPPPRDSKQSATLDSSIAKEDRVGVGVLPFLYPSLLSLSVLNLIDIGSVVQSRSADRSN